MPKITKTLVDTSKPAEAEYVVWDEEIKGFGLRVSKSGVKTYILKYRVGGGRRGAQRKATIGRHGQITPDQARDTAKTWAAQVALGGDPAGEKQAKRKGATVSELLDDFLTDYSEPHNAPSSVKKNRRLIETKIKPVLGKLKVAEVTQDDINSLKKKYRSTPIEANRCLSLISAAFNWAGKGNPVKGVKKYPEQPRSDMVLNVDQIGRLGKALNDLEADGENIVAIAALRTATLTGWRIGEVLSLKRSALDLKGLTAGITGKTGSRKAPVSGPVAVILASLPDGGDFVFSGRSGDKHLDYSVVRRVWAEACKRADIKGFRIHDLRHGAATMGAELGANAAILRDLLGHSTLAMTNRYIARLVDPVRDVSERVALAVSDAMAGRRNAG